MKAVNLIDETEEEEFHWKGCQVYGLTHNMSDWNNTVEYQE